MTRRQLLAMTASGVFTITYKTLAEWEARRAHLKLTGAPAATVMSWSWVPSSSCQASSVYFSTLTTSSVGTCGGNRCAVKLTQSGLQ